MRDAPLNTSSPQVAAPHPLWPTLYLWWRTWRIALAAQDKYETARARGVAHPEAASAAFEALDSDAQPPDQSGQNAHDRGR